MMVGVLAAVYLLFTDRATAILLGVLFFGCLGQAAVYLQLGIEDFYVFLIPAFLVFGLCISAGFGVLLRGGETDDRLNCGGCSCRCPIGLDAHRTALGCAGSLRRA